MDILTRTTQVGSEAFTLFSFDGARWASDLEALREWHEQHEPRGLSGSWLWHYQSASEDSAARGRRRSARTRKRTKERESNSYEPEVLNIDEELAALGGFQIIHEPKAAKVDEA